MAIFPEKLNRLDDNDVPGGLKKIEAYIRYMDERLELSMRSVTRQVTAAGVSNAEIIVLLDNMDQRLSALSSTLNNLDGTVRGIQSTVNSHTESIGNMQTRLTALEALPQTITNIQTALTALDERVTALENAIDRGGTE